MPLISRAGILELVGPHLLFDNVMDAIQSIDQDIGYYTSFPNGLEDEEEEEHYLSD